jgi:hypothetical protein
MVGDLSRPSTNLTPLERRQFICKHINSLTFEDKFNIGDMIIQAGYYNNFVYYNEGTLISLLKLPQELVNTIYNYCVYRVNAISNGRSDIY